MCLNYMVYTIYEEILFRHNRSFIGIDILLCNICVTFMYSESIYENNHSFYNQYITPT